MINLDHCYAIAVGYSKNKSCTTGVVLAYP